MDLHEFHQEIILDHSFRPRNFRIIDGCTHQASGTNQPCGDEITVYLNITDNIVKEIGFQGKGCALSLASASILTTVVRNKARHEIDEILRRFDGSFCGDEQNEPLSELSALSGVKRFPSRIKCATLAWSTFQTAIID